MNIILQSTQFQYIGSLCWITMGKSLRYYCTNQLSNVSFQLGRCIPCALEWYDPCWLASSFSPYYRPKIPYYWPKTNGMLAKTFLPDPLAKFWMVGGSSAGRGISNSDWVAIEFRISQCSSLTTVLLLIKYSYNDS